MSDPGPGMGSSHTDKERGNAVVTSKVTLDERPVGDSEVGRSAARTDSTRPARRRSREVVRVTVAVGMLAGVVSIPFLGVTDSTLVLISNVAMYAALGANWNLISGYTGYIDFGHAVFFGIGGYATAIAMVHFEMPLFAVFPIALCAAAIFAVAIGLPLLRVRGIYFSIAMLGAFLGMREIARLLSFTGGGSGMTIPPWMAENGRTYFYFGFVGLAALGLGLLAWVRRSQLGSSLIAVREDEEGAAARGVNTTAVKLTAFVTAASLTAVVGALWAYQNTFVDPEILFREDLLLYMALVVIVGGFGTVWGPLVGAITVIFIRDVLAANFVQFHQLILGVFLLAIVLLLPNGIVGSTVSARSLMERAAAGLRQLRRRERRSPRRDGGTGR